MERNVPTNERLSEAKKAALARLNEEELEVVEQVGDSIKDMTAQRADLCAGGFRCYVRRYPSPHPRAVREACGGRVRITLTRGGRVMEVLDIERGLAA